MGEMEQNRKVEGKPGLFVRYVANEDFVTRIIAGETVLVPVGEEAKHLSGFVTFTETGAFLWELLSQERTEDELVALTAKEYGVAEEIISEDVRSFLLKAIKRRMVIECSNP